MMIRKLSISLISFVGLFSWGCARPNIVIFPDAKSPFSESLLQGTGKDKVLVVSLEGIISDSPQKALLQTKPSMVQELVSQLQRAEQDNKIKALVLKINSPGGTATASDIIYYELMAYKKRTGAKIVVCMMAVATSGGYYASLPADLIIAHPTSVTGSVGVVMMLPKVKGLMEKIGLDIEVSTYGKYKDMGSPFRQSTEEEQGILQNITDSLGERFISLVKEHRKLDASALESVATGRIYLADEALKLGLLDKIGHLDDAIKNAKILASLAPDAKVVAYRRNNYAEDNPYNTATLSYRNSDNILLSGQLIEALTPVGFGFCYIWTTAIGVY